MGCDGSCGDGVRWRSGVDGVRFGPDDTDEVGDGGGDVATLVGSGVERRVLGNIKPKPFTV